jgi:hypothetical protein
MSRRQTNKMSGKPALGSKRRLLGGVALSAIALWLGSTAAASAFEFTSGDLVIDTVTGTTLDSASPMTLQEFSLGTGGTSAVSVGTLALPQTPSGANSAISGEYGSASEGFLTQSVNGQYLTIMGYGVNASTFNTAPLATYGTAALGQTTSLTGQSVKTVPRVVALIGGNGGVNTSTALTGVFNENNPRSVVTVDGTSFYISGQGASKSDHTTEGVFYVPQLGVNSVTPIDTSTDTRALAISSVLTPGTNTLYVSRDYSPSNANPCAGVNANNCSNVSSLTQSGHLPTSSTGTIDTHIVPPASAISQGGNNGSIDLVPGLFNGVNNARGSDPRGPSHRFVYLSPEQYFFANSTTLYVTDSGQPKNGSVDAAAVGEGGLQKWSLVDGVWTLDYDLVAGLNLVNNDQANSNTPTAPGVTGLFGLTGEVVGGNVELFATSYGLNELSPSYLYEITDSLSCTASPNTLNSCSSGETFATLYTAPTDISIRGVAFAPTGTDDPLTPTPLPASWTFMLIGLAGFGWAAMRRRSNASGLAAA